VGAGSARAGQTPSAGSSMSATMTLPGETEAGSAGMQPCRGIAWWAHRDDVERGCSPLALSPKTYRIGKPPCLENPNPTNGKHLLTVERPAPFHAEPEHENESSSVTPPQVQDRRLKPAGVLPRNAQAWMIGGLSAVMVAIIAFSGGNAPKEKKA